MRPVFVHDGSDGPLAFVLVDAIAPAWRDLEQVQRLWRDHDPVVGSALAELVRACRGRLEARASTAVDGRCGSGVGAVEHILGEDMIGTADAAQRLGCRARNVRDLVARGALRGRRAGRVLLVSVEDVEARAARLGRRAG